MLEVNDHEHVESIVELLVNLTLEIWNNNTDIRHDTDSLTLI
jgi:hypothetical protein